MKLRTECIPLRGVTCRKRPNESETAFQQRQQCPCCQETTNETIAHFLLSCSAYQAPRQALQTSLQLTAPVEFAALDALTAQPEQQWRSLLHEGFWNSTAMAIMPLVATYIVEAWKIRKTTLSGN
jgi:hypothetical protein